MAYLDDIRTQNERIGGQLGAGDRAFFALLHHMKDGEGFINVSSASDMHVWQEAWPADMAERFTTDFSVTAVTKYPPLVTRHEFMEREAAEFLSSVFSKDLNPTEVFLTNGSLTSPSMLMTASPRPVVIYADKCYTSQVAAFRAAGKQPIACQTDVHGRLLLDDLETLLAGRDEAVAYIYLHHNEGAAATVDYLDALYELCERYDTYLQYDADVMATRHRDDVDPLLALDRRYRSRFIVLINFSKEFNAPAIRIGLAIGNKDLVYEMKVYQKHKIEMLPLPSIAIAKLLLCEADVHRSAAIFRQRMQQLVAHLQRRGWETRGPDVGINCFVPVPDSFLEAKQVSPGALFSYYIMKQAKVMVRPGVLHGEALRHTVRFVVSPTYDEIDEVFARFDTAGIHGNMSMPEGLEDAFMQEAAPYAHEA
ncbi:MAG TPA: pyridoxal phosphate-dependent aminotransferase [Candidatus Nanoperiomorbaceae bacterium]|nr:pyridoxal phosphate-dependent aminotransferase [Candidatus Nanoperiomorbaceae bacterium]